MAKWRSVVGYEGKYEVSDDGCVRKHGGAEIGNWIKGGYVLVRLSKPRRLMRVHRLVAMAFLPNPDALPCVNHIDSNPANNRVSNLEWCTQAQNLNHAVVAGRLRLDNMKGIRGPMHLLTDDQVRDMRRIYARGGTSYEKIARAYLVSKRTAGRAIKGQLYADVK